MTLAAAAAAAAALLLAVASAAAAAAAAPQPPAAAVRQGKQTIGAIVAASGAGFDDNHGDFDILLALVSNASLVETLSNTSASFTVFAPSDAAFITSVNDLGFTNVTTEQGAVEALSKLTTLASQAPGGDPIDMLKKLLTYHVVPEKLLKADLLQKKEVKTVEGQTITLGKLGAAGSLEDKAPDLPDPKIVKADMEASNGVVHVIDRLLFNLPASAKLAKGLLGGASATDNITGSASPSPEANVSAEASPKAKAKSSDSSSCFPASAVVHMADGSEVRMAELEAGHEIKVAGDEHSLVYLFTHRQLSGMHEFVRIEAGSGRVITLSKNHYVYANGKMAAADTVKIGDVLSTLDGASRVVSVGTVFEEGLVAPHTLHGDLMVNGVKASSYTRVVHPIVAHALLAPVRALVRMGVAVEPLGGLLYDGADRIAPYMPRGY